MKDLFILGTGTDVGKTVVSAALLQKIKNKNINTCYFKPISSGSFYKDNQLVSYDLNFIRKIFDFDETDNDINPYRFKTPVSPHLASNLEDIIIDPKRILQKYAYLKNKYEFLVVEGCGGLIVPLNYQGYMLHDLIKELNIDCLIVSSTIVGTINHTMLTINTAKSLGICVKGIIFNGYTGTYYEDDNIEIIKKLSGLNVIGIIPKIENLDIEKEALCLKNAYSDKWFFDIL
jgi:dethiobiotin synthetase